MEKNTSDTKATKKKSFLSRFFEKMDKKLEEKVKSSPCCCKGSDKENNSCCS